jgi:hypothetical protein
LRPCLRLCLLFLHLRAVMPDGTTDCGTCHRMVTRQVTGDATDCGTLDAPTRIRLDRQRSDSNEQHQHYQR